MMDRFKLMQTYVAVVRCGSYTRAAKGLDITRAMVSRRIQDLESLLNVKLLNRSTRQLAMTGVGSDYYGSCVNMLEQMQAIEERLLDRRKTLRGSLRILSSKTFGQTMLAPLVADFCKEYPRVSVRVRLRDMAPHGMDLISEGFDLAVRTLPIRDSSLVVQEVVALPLVLVASPEYLKARGEPRTADDLVQHNCLDPSGNPHYVWELRGPDGVLESARVTGTPQVNSSTVIREAAVKGLGIAMLREYLVVDHLKSGALVRILRDHSVAARMLCIVYQKDRYLPLCTRKFIDFLTRRIKDTFQ
jgi:DNA-binding transcriptional LysR family regulator